MSSEGDELHYQLHIIQAFSLRLCPGLSCPCQRQHQGASKRDYVVPVRKEPGLFFLRDVFAEIEGWSHQRTPRTTFMGCSEGGVQLRVPWVVALPPSMEKTSRVHSSQNHQRIRRLWRNVQARILCFQGGKCCC